MCSVATVCDLCWAAPLVPASSIGCQQLKLSKRKLISVRFVSLCVSVRVCVWVNVIVSAVSNLHCGHIGDQVVTMTMQIAWKLIVEANCKWQWQQLQQLKQQQHSSVNANNSECFEYSQSGCRSSSSSSRRRQLISRQSFKYFWQFLTIFNNCYANFALSVGKTKKKEIKSCSCCQSKCWAAANP